MHGYRTSLAATRDFCQSLLRLKPFHFKHFTIHKNTHSFPVGSDAMMLGALVIPIVGGHILDAGAGSGVLGLMLAQRCTTSQVDCLELDPSALEECAFNVANSPFKDRMTAMEGNIWDFTSTKTYNLVVTNPPYHLSQNPSDVRNEREKHTNTGALRQWFYACFQVLSEKGHCWLIAPSQHRQALQQLFAEIGFYVVQCVAIQNQHHDTVREVYCLGKTACASQHNTIIIREKDGSYSAAYIELTKEFHGISITKATDVTHPNTHKL